MKNAAKIDREMMRHSWRGWKGVSDTGKKAREDFMQGLGFKIEGIRENVRRNRRILGVSV